MVYRDYENNKIKSNRTILLDEFTLLELKKERNGQYLNTNGFKYCTKVIKHDLKINFNYHSLRYPHATMLLENGTNLKDVQERLAYSKLD